MTAFAELLHGDDPRKLHGVGAVVDVVLHAPQRFGELIACLGGDDPVVRMRAADAAEKITRAMPDLLEPHRAALLALAETTDQPSLRWHLAQMLPRAPLDPNEQRAFIGALRRWLDDGSAIVKTSALQALADIALDDPSLRRMVLPAIRKAIDTGTAAVRTRGERLLASLEGDGRRAR